MFKVWKSALCEKQCMKARHQHKKWSISHCTGGVKARKRYGLSYGLVLQDVTCDNSDSYQDEAEPVNPQEIQTCVSVSRGQMRFGHQGSLSERDQECFWKIIRL